MASQLPLALALPLHHPHPHHYPFSSLTLVGPSIHLRNSFSIKQKHNGKNYKTSRARYNSLKLGFTSENPLVNNPSDHNNIYATTNEDGVTSPSSEAVVTEPTTSIERSITNENNETVKEEATGIRDGDEVKFEAKFEVPLDFGEIGAVIVRNEHFKEMYLYNISLDPSSESRSDEIYLPRDEEFSEVKSHSLVKSERLGAIAHASLRSLIVEGSMGKKFPYFTKIDTLFVEGINLEHKKHWYQDFIPGFLKKLALDQGKLFILDYHDLFLQYVNKVRDIEGTTLYGSRTLMFLKPTEELIPVAIELTCPPANNEPQWKQVFTPSSNATDAWLWKLAKAHVLAHDSGYHQLVSHWYVPSLLGRLIHGSRMHGYFPNRPSIARTKMPNEVSKEEEVEEKEEWKKFVKNPEQPLLACFPSVLQATIVIAVLDVLSTHSKDEEYIGQCIEPTWEENQILMSAFQTFTSRLRDLKDTIDGRNVDKNLKKRTGAGLIPYELFIPTSKEGVTGQGVPNSISI
ncbi:hypothetical protein LguiA_013259 [Lonicera macranthoides]